MSRELLGATDPATVLGGMRGAPGSGDAGLLPGDTGSPRHSPVAVGLWDAYCSREDSRVQHPGVPLWLMVGETLNASWVLLSALIPGGLVSTPWDGSGLRGVPLQPSAPCSEAPPLQPEQVMEALVGAKV